MNAAYDVLTRATLAGIRFTASGDKLLAEPTGLLTDELRTLIRANKPGLMRAVAALAAWRERTLDDVRRQTGRRTFRFFSPGMPWSRLLRELRAARHVLADDPDQDAVPCEDLHVYVRGYLAALSVEIPDQ